MTVFISTIVGDLDGRSRRRHYKSRVNALPPRHRRAVRALERYLAYAGAVTAGDIPSGVLMSLFEDVLDVMERAATDGQGIRAVVGDDPVPFAESILRGHADVAWRDGETDRSVSAVERRVHDDIQGGLTRERRRLVAAIARPGTDGRGTRS